MTKKKIRMPNKNCGLCGSKSCAEFGLIINKYPEKKKLCIYLEEKSDQLKIKPEGHKERGGMGWEDALGRPFDFLLDSYEEGGGPVEIIHPFNYSLIKKLKAGSVIIGRPLAAGCPVTHCGEVLEVDLQSGLIKWRVIGPLAARNALKNESLVDVGSYCPVVFEGIVAESKVPLAVGMRYYFMPRKCMLQWRHSGIIGFLKKIKNGYQVRIEGIFLG